MRLGINVDHVATLRQARDTRYPNPIAAAILAEKGGADQITVHLREDRRHIQEEDVRELRKSINSTLNLEMAAIPSILDFALTVRPDTVTLVPERRQERTTERGLQIQELEQNIASYVQSLKQKGIEVSLFIDPETAQIESAVRLGAEKVEFHTGSLALATDEENIKKEIQKLKQAAQKAKQAGLLLAAGHGLNYDNIEAILNHIPEIEEYNIGHSIVARSIFVGMEQATREMKDLLTKGGRDD